jgi:Zn-dependent peptidase ImmA (M78 family)/transcriptional regulator with XRE-family HTH domain
MVLMAREALGLTQTELQERTGIPQSRLSNIQNGQRTLEGEDLEKVADALEVSPELLCWDDEPLGFGSASFFHRKQQSLSQKHLRAIQARVNLLRIRFSHLLREVSIEPEAEMPRIDVYDAGTASEVARRLRAAWRLPMGPVDNVVELIEAAGGCVFQVDFETHRINAISVWHPGSGPIFCVNKNLAPENQRFVLCHEIGHMVMHEGSPPEDSAEHEADEFAEEFLMPNREIKSQLRDIDLRNAASLKPYWKVPMQSLILRSHHLGLITDGRCRSLHAYMNKLGYLKAEPYPVELEMPGLVQDIVRLHLSEHGYTERMLGQLLGGHGFLIPHHFAPSWKLRAV